MSETLFEGYDPPPVVEAVPMSADRRRTQRQADDIAIGRHPLTGGPLHPLASRHRGATAPKDDPFTCGSCWHRMVLRYHDKSYPKCVFGETTEKPGPYLTHGASTDVRAWWPACPDYSPGDRLSEDAARYVPERSDG